MRQAVADLCEVLYRGRTIAFDERAARAYGQIAAEAHARGRPMAQMDALIASVAQAHGATLATRNVRDFEGIDIDLINPFEHLP